MKDSIRPVPKWRKMVPATFLYLAKILRTVFLVVKSPAVFCRNVMDGTPPPGIVSPRALIATVLVLSTVLALLFADQDKDRSWLVSLSMLQISERESFDRVFPGLRNVNVGESLVHEMVALLFGPSGKSPTVVYLSRLLSEKVTSNALERYIASKDEDLAARYHSLTWTMDLGATFGGWWRTVEPILYWYVVCLLMHLSIPAPNTSVSRGIAAQQYVIFGFMLSFGLPMFFLAFYLDSVPWEKLIVSTAIPVAFFVSFAIYLTSMVIALRAIAKAYRHAVLVTIGIFCFIAIPIASVATSVVEWTSRMAFAGFSQYRDPEEAAAAQWALAETASAILQGGRQKSLRHEFGVGILFEVKPDTGAKVTGVIRNGAAQVSGEIKVGDTIVMLKRTPDSEWMDLKAMDYESIRAMILGERNTEIVFLVKRQSEPAAEPREVTLRRKRLPKISNPWLQITE